MRDKNVLCHGIEGHHTTSSKEGVNIKVDEEGDAFILGGNPGYVFLIAVQEGQHVDKEYYQKVIEHFRNLLGVQ